ncbi:MAG: diguanylate cyclase [Proteobacteria bacterium]|nr:diguanylate cyclase [Pseudomonadota bacterium]
MTAATPAQIAKGALRRLAMAQLEPTPENYARAFAEEAGHAATVLPERARPLLERLLARLGDEPQRRDELLQALMQGRWEQAGQALERHAQSASAQAQAWATLVERLVRALQRGSRQWSVARKKESLQRVLDGSRSDLQRLQQRLAALVGSWESDGPLPADDGVAVAEGPSAAAAEAADAQAQSHTNGHIHAHAENGHGAVAGGDWPTAIDHLRLTVNAALPPGEARAAELADRLGALADRLAGQGPTTACLQDLDAVCDEIRRLFAHRHHLVDQVNRLCAELGLGLAELAEDESWARGQAEVLHARLAEGLNVRSVRAATVILAETRERHARVRAEREQARNALKQLINRMLGEIGELGEQTDRFHDNVSRHVRAIEAADSIEGLAGVVRELVDDSHSVQQLVRQAQSRLQGEHDRARQLEEQVRSLEGELRRLSDEVSTDALTRVANRRGLTQAFEVEAARRERDGAGAPLAVGLIDIDNFKKLNDSLGHAAGDKALQSLAAEVRQRLRPVDHLARFGGEEFVVLLPATALDEARETLTRLQRALSAALFMHDEREVFVTFSAGVTEWRPGEALEAALGRADEALYEAKRTGKNRTCAA